MYSLDNYEATRVEHRPGSRLLVTSWTVCGFDTPFGRTKLNTLVRLSNLPSCLGVVGGYMANPGGW